MKDRKGKQRKRRKTKRGYLVVGGSFMFLVDLIFFSGSGSAVETHETTFKLLWPVSTKRKRENKQCDTLRNKTKIYIHTYWFENNFARLTPLINRYVKKEISYYVLEIIFNMEKNEHDLMFRNPINNKWLKRCRTIIDGNPCCVWKKLIFKDRYNSG